LVKGGQKEDDVFAQAIELAGRFPGCRLVVQPLLLFWVAAQMGVTCGCQTTRVPSGRSPDADALMSRGAAAMQRGALADAIASWREAEASYAARGRADGRFDALIDMTAAYQSLGKYEQAEQTSDQATALLSSLQSPARRLSALLAQADLYTFTHRYAAAEEAIEKGLGLSRRLGMTHVEAEFQNASGNLLVRQRRFADALSAYKLSASLAGKHGDHVLCARALANAATAAALVPDPRQTIQFSHEAMAEISPMQTGRPKLTLLLTVGQGLESLVPAEAERIYRDAAFEANTIGNRQSLSYALGYQGRLCRSTGRTDEGLRLTRQAAAIAQDLQNPQILFRWLWQAGQILAQQGKLNDAISAYESGINAMESVRIDLTLGNGNSTGGTFRQRVGPIYYELADLLLRRADGQPDLETRQVLYRQARRTVEQLKSAQLEDYFQDRCEGLLKGRLREIEAVDPHTAVIYFISLRDRTEILVSIGDLITRFTAQVTADQLQRQALEFRNRLEDRTSRRYLYNAQTLYDWLLRPLEPTLREHQIGTLVFVPDASLCTVPLAALHDGADFLIARYAVAVTPGLTLMDPRPTPFRSPLVLEAGLSESRFGFPALPFVPAELKSLQHIYGGRTLLNKAFCKANLRSELLGKDYTIVHIASHVEFGNSAQSTFLVTYSDKLTLDDVEMLILPTRFRDRPLELLTLDCCNTAADDERSTEGMAGIAIEAGARSTVATLWPVNDAASSLLMQDFYTTLRNDPKMSRARAMQHAQETLLHDDRYAHPEYWAPYLVIGNWL
jgi:CHAT domain-containing protein